MEGFVDPILINRMTLAVNNAYAYGQRSLGDDNSSFDRRRNIGDECGFPDSFQITPEKLRQLYKRDAIAGRVVELWPRECWQVNPSIFEVHKESIATPFEITWNNLGKSLQSEPGYYKEQESSALYEYLQRADIMSGIGRYGVMLLGIDDGLPLDQPATYRADTKLLYIRIFDESLAQITQRESNNLSPRNGQPTMYQVTFDNATDVTASVSSQMGITSSVHWSRIVHIVDNIQSNEVYGTYRLEPVLNDILTSQKSRWGSGEMFWKGASPKISFETNPQLGGDVVINKPRMKDQIEKVINGLQQYWFLTGMQAKPIAPVAVDPKPFIDACIQSICIKLGIPVRIFMGSERGELASTQDDDAWNDRVKERQNRQVTPRVICPFINRCINLGILPIPTQGYQVEWQDITSQSAKDKATVQTMRLNMLANFIKSGLDTRFNLIEFMGKFLDMSKDEAQSLLVQVPMPVPLIEPPIV